MRNTSTAAEHPNPKSEVVKKENYYIKKMNFHKNKDEIKKPNSPLKKRRPKIANYIFK